MARTGDTYSRVVGTLKVLLPLAALGVLSTLFIFSGEVDPSQSLPYVELNVEQIAREQRIGAPYLAGVNADGTAITITGASVTPEAGDSGRFTIEEIRAEFETAAAERLVAQAPRAQVDMGTSLAVFSGGAEVTTSRGVALRTDSIRVDLAGQNLESVSQVEATGPFGAISADQLAIQRPPAGGTHVLMLQGNVRVVILPGGG